MRIRYLSIALLLSACAGGWQTFVSDVTRLEQPSIQLVGCALPAVTTAVNADGGIVGDLEAAAQLAACAASFGLSVSQEEAVATVKTVRASVSRNLSSGIERKRLADGGVLQ